MGMASDDHAQEPGKRGTEGPSEETIAGGVAAEEDGHRDEPGGDHEPTFRDFLISFRTMEYQLRALAGIVLAEIVSSVILIAAKDELLPRLMINLRATGIISVPWVCYGVAGLSVLWGLYLLTRGTFEATVKGRLLFVGVLLAFFLACILGSIIGNPVLLVSLVLMTLFYCGMAGILPRAYRKYHAEDNKQNNVFIYSFVVISVAPGIFLLLAAPQVFSNFLIILSLPLVIIFFLAGTDWAEILDSLGRTLMESNVGMSPVRWLAGMGMALCCGSVVLMTVSSDWAAWRYLPAMGGAVLFVGAVMRLAKLGEKWHMHFSWAGMVILIAVFELLMSVASRAGGGTIAPVWPSAFSVVAAVLLIGFARRGKHAELWPILVFAMILGMLWAVAGSSRLGALWAPVKGTMLAIAVGSLLGIMALLWVSRSGKDVRGPLFHIVVLNVGCLAIYGLAFGVYAGALAAGEQAELIEALVVFVAIVWDILVSGHSITNIEGKMFSRRSRVFLFFGYVFLVMATIVFWSSAEIIESPMKDWMKMLGSPETFVQLGIALFGPATLLTLFVLRVGKWLPGRGAESLNAAGS